MKQALEDVIRPGSPADLDFIIVEELVKKSGTKPEEALQFSLHELLCNSLDSDATQVWIDARRVDEFHQLTVADNGSKKIQIEDLRLILDFTNKASSKRGFLRVSRGYLGNALKSIFGFTHALAESKGLTPPTITVESHGSRYSIDLKPNRVKGKIESTVKEERPIDNEMTAFIIKLPSFDQEIPRDQLYDIIFATSMVNPYRRIHYALDGLEGSLGMAKESKSLRRETSMLWYTEKQSEILFNDFLRARPSTQLKEYLSLFRGLTSKTKHRQILRELSASGNQDSHMQFLPSTPIRDVPPRIVATLHEKIKSKTRPISKRSVPGVLGIVGEETFELVKQENDWLGLRYAKQVGFTEVGNARFPFLVEVVVFDRKPDGEGLKIYQCCNFMSSRRNYFSRVYDINYRVGRVNIGKDTPVTVLIHLVCPVLDWLDYGKTSLYAPGLREHMGKAFNKVLPIPKTPREYRVPPPRRPLSWLPKGKISTYRYRLRLMDFAEEIKAIDEKKARQMKFSSRGWSYILEGLSKIHKGELDAGQKAVNDCRKLGYLPLDFVAPDQDETRRFAGIHEASEPASLLKRIKSEIGEMLDALPASTTDYWARETYYVMMCVEKGDIRNLFKPICDRYHIPIVNSKGWYPILLRAHIASLSKKAEARGLKPVLLLFYDHDPAGIKISKRFRKGLWDVIGGTGWDPSGLIIDRFGLNADDINRYGLPWIENLKSSSGRESQDWDYIAMFGRRKCESNALFRNEESLRAGEEICRQAIERYYGSDALRRFEEKESQSRSGFSFVYEDPVWSTLVKRLDVLIEKLDTEGEGGDDKHYRGVEDEFVVEVDTRFYGVCPRCLTTFNYDSTDIGRLYRCRHCQAPMRLKKCEM
jgi:hypothetical protein